MVFFYISSLLMFFMTSSLGQPPEFKNHIMLHLDDGPLRNGDEVVLDGKFRNKLAQLRFISLSDNCPGPAPRASHVHRQCHPLVMRFRPRFHLIQIYFKGHPNSEQDIWLRTIQHNGVRVGLSYRLLIKVHTRQFLIYFNGESLYNATDEVDHNVNQITHIRSYGGYFREYYVVRGVDQTMNSRIVPNDQDIGTCGMRPGLSTADVRITGGENAKAGEFPWQAALRRKLTLPWATYKHLCGASLIQSCWVLTAAHCVVDVAANPNNYVVRVGDYYNGDDGRYTSREAEQDFDIDSVITHEEFQIRPSPRNDIALIKLASNTSTCAVISDFVRPICLPTRSETKPKGFTCTVTGWGAANFTDRPDQFPKILQKAEIKIKDHDECRDSYGFNQRGVLKVATKTVCAADEGKDACQADSGGPLSCKRVEGSSGTNFVLWGITSWGEGCATPDRPGIYTKVVDYLEWIYNNMYQNQHKK